MGHGGADRPGLYVHVPFCSAICPYCDFAVLPARPELKAGFVPALAAEAALWGARGFPGGAFDTIYLGGGTPSILAPAQLAALLGALRASLPIAPDAWITLEANPEDVTPEAAAAWRALGVETVSLGVQSFDDAALRFLGRRHDREGALRAVERTLAAGFPIVGVDLIYGLPGLDESGGARWRRDLATAAGLAPQHLSCYQLTVHEKTPFGWRRERGGLAELPEPLQAELFLLTHEELGARGWEGYEVSNFARAAAHRSRHNAKYWRHAPYLGLGPSAHSFDGATRWWNHRKLRPWQGALATGAVPVEGREPIGSAERALEHLLLGLRTREGVDLALLRRLGLDLEADPRLPRLLADGLLRHAGGRLAPTLAGWAVADGLAAALAPAAGAVAGAPRPAVVS
jgi:oxygen-independent coproporphyrinogen-3 oxidase